MLAAIAAHGTPAQQVLVKHGNGFNRFEVGRGLTSSKIKAFFDNLQSHDENGQVNYVNKDPDVLYAQMPDGTEQLIRADASKCFTLECFPTPTLGCTFLLESKDADECVGQTGITKRQMQMAFALSEAVYSDDPASELCSYEKNQDFLNVETVRSDLSNSIRYAVGFPRFTSHQSQGEVYIAIRGSENRDDWMRNLDVAPKIVSSIRSEDADVALRSLTEVDAASLSRQERTSAGISSSAGTSASTMHRGFADSSLYLPLELLEDLVHERQRQLAEASPPSSDTTAWSENESDGGYDDTDAPIQAVKVGYPDAHHRQIQVILAGHSAGGAVAHCVHSLWRLTKSQAPVTSHGNSVQVASVGFGSPFFASRALGKELAKLPGNKGNRMFLNVVNGDDPVPRCLNVLETLKMYQKELSSWGTIALEAVAGFVMPPVAAKIAVNAAKVAIQNLDKVSKTVKDWQNHVETMYYPIGHYCFLQMENVGGHDEFGLGSAYRAGYDMETDPGKTKKRLGAPEFYAESAHYVENYRKMLGEASFFAKLVDEAREVTPQHILEPDIDPKNCTYTSKVSEDQKALNVTVRLAGRNFNYFAAGRGLTRIFLEDYGSSEDKIELVVNLRESGRSFIVVSGSVPKERIRRDLDTFNLRVTSIFGYPGNDTATKLRWRNGKMQLGYMQKGDIAVELTMADQMRAEFLEPLLTNLVHRSVVAALFIDHGDIEQNNLVVLLQNLDSICDTRMAKAALHVRKMSLQLKKPARIDQEILDHTVKEAEREVQKVLKKFIDPLAITFQYSNVTKGAVLVAASGVVGGGAFVAGGAAVAALAPAWAAAWIVEATAAGVGSIAAGIGLVITARGYRNLLEFEKKKHDDEKYREILKEICKDLNGVEASASSSLKVDELEQHIVKALAGVSAPPNLQVAETQAAEEVVFRKEGRLHDKSVCPQHVGKSEALQTLFPNSGIEKSEHGKHTLSVTFYPTELDGQQVTVVDCPGFDGVLDSKGNYMMKNQKEMELMMRHGCFIGSIFLCLLNFGSDVNQQALLFNDEVISNPNYVRYPKLLMVNKILENSDYMHKLQVNPLAVDAERRKYSDALHVPISQVQLTDMRIGKIRESSSIAEQTTHMERSHLARERGVWGKNEVTHWIRQQISDIHEAAAL
ncbi:hypothetical protein HDU93_002635 [Gonapodya sp. JEL0774]|nr:hypothetical protein HDU93_002635 [Gonapodya sp. JEL0774]